MNKAEKALAKKVKAFYESPKIDAGFTRDENIILERWRAYKIIDEKAFIDMTAGNDDYKSYVQTLNYPFTSFGDQTIKKNWYFRFRESTPITIIRDILLVISFAATLLIALTKIFQK